MVSCVLAAVSVIGQGTSTGLTRADFVQRLNCVEAGNSQQYVEWLLGKPDRVDFTEPSNPEARQYWRFGCEGPNSLATLGSVAIQKGKVIMVIGRGEPPKPATIGEVELRHSLQKMYRITELDQVSGDDPLMMIRAANSLIALGQSKAIVILEELYRVHRSDRRIRVLIRALFDIPSEGKYPLDPWIPDPANLDLKMNPRWPIAIKDDVVFTFRSGWGGAGNVGPIRLVLEPLSKSTKMRTKPFVPGDDPFVAAKKIKDSGRWMDSGGTDELLLQVLRLVRTAYTPTKKLDNLTWTDFDLLHQEYLKVGGRWDKATQSYVRQPATPLEK